MRASEANFGEPREVRVKRGPWFRRLPLAEVLGAILAAIALGGDPAWAGPPAPPAASASAAVDLIVVDGVINPASAEFITDSIRNAGNDRAAALVIELDTPGGLLASARTIVKALLNSPVPVIV